MSETTRDRKQSAAIESVCSRIEPNRGIKAVVRATGKLVSGTPDDQREQARSGQALITRPSESAGTQGMKAESNTIRSEVAKRGRLAEVVDV